MATSIASFIILLFTTHINAWPPSPHGNRHDSGYDVCASNVSSAIFVQSPLDPLPYSFPSQEAVGTVGLFPMQNCKGMKLEEASIDDLQDAMNAGELTALKLAECYLTRHEQVDGYINSVLEVNPNWREIASNLDTERACKKIRSPLHGIPFLIKDNIATADKLETTAGSWALMGSIVPRDAFVVSALRKSGALLLGKATLSEWADMRSNNYSEGYSARGGQARSPYNLTVNPGGSSSGSAAAVAANVVPFALGTETDGSVINPAERNGVVGFKPTVGLTSRNGVVPESKHQDSVGTFGKTVKDAVLALDTIYGVDRRDNYTLAQRGKTPADGYLQFLGKSEEMRGARFGIPWDSFWVYADAEQQATLLSIIELVETAGATVVNHTELPNYQTIVPPDGWDWDYGGTRGYPNESEYTVVATDFYNNINTYLSELSNTNIRTIEDIIAYNYANDGTEGGNPWPLGIAAFYSGQDGLLASLATGGVMNKTYFQALQFIHRSTREDGIDAALANSGEPVDALLMPPDVGQTYQIAAQAGYPMITLPAAVGSDSGMPYGLALMVSAWEEEKLVRFGSAIEHAIYKDGRYGRTLPKWYGYLTRNVPVL